jgi:hypothetical protein
VRTQIDKNTKSNSEVIAGKIKRIENRIETSNCSPLPFVWKRGLFVCNVIENKSIKN